MISLNTSFPTISFSSTKSPNDTSDVNFNENFKVEKVEIFKVVRQENVLEKPEKDPLNFEEKKAIHDSFTN